MNKVYLKLIGIVGAIGGLVGLAGKAGAYNIVNVDATSVSSTMAYVSNLFSDVSIFIWLAIGLPLGFWVISKVISLIRVRAR